MAALGLALEEPDTVINAFEGARSKRDGKRDRRER